MHQPNVRSGLFIAIAAALLCANTQAADILVLTGNGTSSLDAPLKAAGFNVINGTLSPGQIAGNITPSTVGVYIWNDGSLGNTGSPANPALNFNAADESALLSFATTHNKIIMDGLSWRSNANADEQALSKNEASLLASNGGGIVLGADDSSGAEIVQHVNEVAGWLGYNLFSGTYSTSPANQVFGGTLFDTPNAVNPTNVVGTTTYSEIPNGLQPNGVFLTTALFGFNSIPLPQYGPSPALSSATFNGTTYDSVNHLITTNIEGAGINRPPVPEPQSLLLMTTGLLSLMSALRRTTRRKN